MSIVRISAETLFHSEKLLQMKAPARRKHYAWESLQLRVPFSGKLWQLVRLRYLGLVGGVEDQGPQLCSEASGAPLPAVLLRRGAVLLHDH